MTTFRSFLALVTSIAMLAVSFVMVTSPANAQGRTSDYIAPTSTTNIPVYDTAWHMFSRGTPEQADEYFGELARRGFTGAWSMVIGHAPTTYNLTYDGGGLIGEFSNGEIVLSDGYIAHVNEILDAAHSHGMQMGLVVAWQNLYLPGGRSDAHVATSEEVRGTLTVDNAAAYGRQMVDAFGDHPAVNSWVLGGDAGSNNTAENIPVWEIMAEAIRGEGSTIDIGIHLPPYQFDSLLYADVDFLDFAAPEIGHTKTPEQGQWEMEVAVEAYDIPVWMGEARYFNSNFQWVNPAELRNPGVAEMVADAVASRNAGVQGYLYGDAGRMTWCANYGQDTTPCDRDNVADSFGPAEDGVIEVFSSGQPVPEPPAPTLAPPATPAPTPPAPPATPAPTPPAPPATPAPTPDPPVDGSPSIPLHFCRGEVATIVGTIDGEVIAGTNGDDVIVGLGGDDVIDGRGGNDIICGNRGNDIISGGLGFDSLVGGSGGDVLYANSKQDRSDIAGAELRGGAGRDVLVGSNHADLLFGEMGRDRLSGFGGQDVLRGGRGDDVLQGGASVDELIGGNGADVFVGGSGRDTCVQHAEDTSAVGCEG